MVMKNILLNFEGFFLETLNSFQNNKCFFKNHIIIIFCMNLKYCKQDNVLNKTKKKFEYN